MSMINVFAGALEALREADPAAKGRAVRQLQAAWAAGDVSLAPAACPVESLPVPGRPERPELVSPRAVPRRQLATIEGRAILIHALAHIEFNAINLALDAVYRFRDLPRAYYGDWLRVAAEEAYHFALLREHLQTLGYDYGRFAAHNGLWEMAVKTAHDPLVRMALVPRVLEARGLDAAPGLIKKLQSSGDRQAVKILEIIQRDEVTHVAIGNRWYHYLCAQRGLDPLTTFEHLLKAYDAPPLRPPFAQAARRQAGFTEDEMQLLERLAGR